MKKEIMNVITSESAELKVTPFGLLRRNRKDAIGNPVDKLWLDVKTKETALVIYEIKSRNYDEVIEEIELAIRDYFERLTERTCKALRNGRLD